MSGGIPPQLGDRRMAGSAPADACGRPLDDLYPVYIRLRDTYIRSDPRLFHTAVRSRTVGDCIIFLKALFQFPILGLLCILRYTIQGAGYTNLAMLSGVSEMIARTLVSIYAVPIFGFLAVCFGDPTAWIGSHRYT